MQLTWCWEMGLQTLTTGCSYVKDLEYLFKEFVFTLNNICILSIEVFEAEIWHGCIFLLEKPFWQLC